MFKKLMKDEKGFTLVELIVVIAILAVLATLLIPRIMGNVKDAAKQSEISTARTLASEITVFNARAAADVTGTIKPIPAALPAEGAADDTVEWDDIKSTELALPKEEDFPDKTVVLIKVDSDGNAHIEDAPTTP